ncbi:MAG: D-amino acid aminotransferase [Pseudomonadota bacterium]|nr:D-amino acid aminotransferase [Pseudomonadota bacterium]
MTRADVSPAYLDGRFLPLSEARVSALDRGFLFGDAVYEVIPVYAGRSFRLSAHLRRLARSLSETRISPPCSALEWSRIVSGLIERAGSGDLSVYLQVTRGVAPRDHAFPDTPPTVFAMAGTMTRPSQDMLRQGVAAVTRPDIRWRRCDIKTTSLIGNVMLRQQAVENGAAEAILIRDGIAVEGAATNLFIVSGGVIVTPPKGVDLLPGITRDVILELVRKNETAHEEREIPEAELRAAGEVWITSSTKEVLAVTSLDGDPVGDGRPGPVWRKIWSLLREDPGT